MTDERAEFERTFATGDGVVDRFNFHRGGRHNFPESYTADRIQALWEGWQKRAQHPDTQGEAVAWVVRGRSDGRIWMVDLDRDEALACATEAGDTLIPLYASPPSDSGVSPQAGEASPSSEGSLRRALLALADRWTAIVGDEGANFGRHCCAQDLRELAGQGTLSVGSSDEVAP
jgi:hypothetical protein